MSVIEILLDVRQRIPQADVAGRLSCTMLVANGVHEAHPAVSRAPGHR
jgi:hypothetical protein